jgi:signal transduction histidine kinase
MSDYLAVDDAEVPPSRSGIDVRAQRDRPILQLIIGLLGTASFRLAIVYAMAFGISSFILSISLWHSTSSMLDRGTQSAIRVYAKSFAQSYSAGGLVALTKSVDAEANKGSNHHGLFLLVDPNGDRIAGNLEEWPTSAVIQRKWYLLTLGHGSEQMSAFYRYYLLPDGFKLLVGHDTKVEMRLLGILRHGMLSALVEMIILGLVGSIMIRLLVQRGIADLSTVADAISEGDLTKRVRQRSSGHEFDRIANAVNDILDRMNILVEDVRNVSNSIAHDLRTPITRVRVRLEDALLYATETDELRSAIELATCDLDRVSQIFHAMLRIAEVESGTRRSAFKEFDLLQILSNLTEMYGVVAEERGIALVSDIDYAIKLFGDDQMIQQALANLIDNAIKFSPPGRTIQLLAISDDRNAQIVVRDEGPGIPERDRLRATDRFYRAEAARNTPGSGLGLALASAVCGLHGGHLHLENKFPGLEARIVMPRTPLLQ